MKKAAGKAAFNLCVAIQSHTNYDNMDIECSHSYGHLA